MNGRQRALSAAFAAMFLSGLTMMSSAGELDPKAVVFGMKQLGVDVSAWTGERSPVP